MVSFPQRLIKKLAVALVAFLILPLWQLAYRFGCWSLLFAVGIGLIVFKSSYEIASAKKICVAGCYFKQESWVYKLFTKKFFLYIFSVIGGVILSVVLLTSVVDFTLLDYMLLFIDMVFIVYFYDKFSSFKFLNPEIKNAVVKNYISGLSALVMVFVFLAVHLYQKPPNYLQNDIVQTMRMASSKVSSECSYIKHVVKASTEITAVKWWLMEKYTIEGKNEWIKRFVWIVFLLGNYLMLFAFTRYILEAIDLVKRLSIEHTR